MPLYERAEAQLVGFLKVHKVSKVSTVEKVIVSGKYAETGPRHWGIGTAKPVISLLRELREGLRVFIGGQVNRDDFARVRLKPQAYKPQATKTCPQTVSSPMMWPAT